MLIPRLRGRLIEAGVFTLSTVVRLRLMGREGRIPPKFGEGDRSRGDDDSAGRELLLQLLFSSCRLMDLVGVLHGELLLEVFWCIVSAV